MKRTSAVNLIFDFDSTFVKVEALDELFRIALENHKNKDKIVGRIEKITALGMDGSISFPESLRRRFKLLTADKRHIEKLTKLLKKNISESIKKNKKFFQKNCRNIYMISGGFQEYICPVVEDFGIKKKNVLANKFIFDRSGNIIGFDKNRLMAKNNGKVKEVKRLGLKGEAWIIGDGYTDYQIKEAGAAQKFIAFCENIRRDKIIQKADLVARDFDEFLSINKIK